jgi:hypothetical protein
MKPYDSRMRLVGTLVARRRSRWGRLPAALALILALSIAGTAKSQAASSAAASTHVYLLRGVLNIFSLGLDDLAAKLQRQGITVTVANYLSWSSLADAAAAEYRSGRTKTIVLVGHSSGATALPDMVARLDQLGTPVKLAIGLDSVFRTSLSGRVGRYVNFYVANGNGEPVAKTSQLKGTLENVDVGKIGMAHLTIDKSEVMHQKVIAAINSVVSSGSKVASEPKPQPEVNAAGQGDAAGQGKTAAATPRN